MGRNCRADIAHLRSQNLSYANQMLDTYASPRKTRARSRPRSTRWRTACRLASPTPTLT